MKIFLPILCLFLFFYLLLGGLFFSQILNIQKRSQEDSGGFWQTQVQLIKLDQEQIPLSLEKIFADSRSDIFPKNDSALVSLLATGDIMPGRGVDERIRKYGNPLYPVEKIRDFFATVDMVLVNLEAPLVSGCPLTLEGVRFCGQTSFVESLKAIKTTVVGLENNHIGNYGSQGIEQTKSLLSKNGLLYADRNQLAIKKAGGQSFGFLAFNGVGETINRDDFYQKITAAKAKVDVLVLAIHWGREYTHTPQSDPATAPDNPQEIAYLAVDAGADLIIGNHPHWVQGLEIYKNKLINYSHGNFIFDQMWSAKTQQGVIGLYQFQGKELVNVHLYPIKIEDYAQPRVLTNTDPERIDILNNIQTASF